MTHGWRGRLGQLARAAVGVVLVGGPVGCVGSGGAKPLVPKTSVTGTLPPPNIPGAGTMPATPPGERAKPSDTQTSNRGAVPATTVPRTASTPSPALIESPRRQPDPLDALRQTNDLSLRPNPVASVVMPTTPGVVTPDLPRPAATTQVVPNPVIVNPVTTAPKTLPPATLASSTAGVAVPSAWGKAGLTSTLPPEQPIAVSSINPPLPPPDRVPSLPNASGPSAAIDGPIVPVGALQLGQ